MDFDNYGEVVNGENTYNRIAEKLNISGEPTVTKLTELVNNIIKRL